MILNDKELFSQVRSQLPAELLEKYTFETKDDFWSVLDHGDFDEAELSRLWSQASGMRLCEDEELDDIAETLPLNFTYLFENHQIPLMWDDESITIALAQPCGLAHIASFYQNFFHKKIAFVLARPSVIKRKLGEIYENQAGSLDSAEGGSENEETLKNLAQEAPIIRLVNDVMARAVEVGASDIHVEPSENELLIRYRVDGMLQTYFTPSIKQYSAISTRLKLIGGLNIAERRIPQDGRIAINVGKSQIDLRMSTLPAMHGESIVMRLLIKNSSGFTLENLGMLPKMHEDCSKLIKRPHGIFLVVGPTGSGKSTTLYAFLTILNQGREKIITVEDPVEYQVGGITQVQVNTQTGLTFAAGLRAIVRQDPDIIFVGEIRDRETAEISIQSALTGHMVFSTLHTNNAAGAISRLQDIGIENFLIASSLLAVLSQRLLRKICPDCEGKTYDDDTITCRTCNNSGYKGRVGVYELLTVSDRIREAINASADSGAIAKIAIEEGMTTLLDDGMEKVAQGLTRESEVRRVVFSDQEM